MAYDALRQRVVLFGGVLNTNYLSDTWEWDGVNWIQRVPSTVPTQRASHAMVYDVTRQRVVLFGGTTGGLKLGDTWEWDGVNWIQRVPSAAPLPRSSHAMAYDSGRQRVVLFGGEGAGSNLFGDTWEWDGNAWLARFSTSHPSPRGWTAMAYDGARQRIVLFGGAQYPTSSLADTWEWDGTAWLPNFTPTYPLTRDGHSMAYDEARQRVVLFGGNNSTGPLIVYGDTWWLGNLIFPATATSYGSGCGSPALSFIPDATGRPLLGQVALATIANAPTQVVGVALGWSNQYYGPFALPVTLAGIGMPGCDLLQSADILGLGTSPLTPSTLSFSLSIPNVPGLIGLHLYLQAYAFAPGANPLQIIISNGIDWRLGDT